MKAAWLQLSFSGLFVLSSLPDNWRLSWRRLYNAIGAADGRQIGNLRQSVDEDEMVVGRKTKANGRAVKLTRRARVEAELGKCTLRREASVCGWVMYRREEVCEDEKQVCRQRLFAVRVRVGVGPVAQTVTPASRVLKR